ncbi:MAG: alanyl-tRNA editing protein [Promethearchaeota archaeon]
MTQKLYWKTPYETKFRAKIEVIRENGIVLDKTLFYPESGNQISDRGYFRIKDLKIEVFHVVKDGEDILHQVSPNSIKNFNIGDQVEGEIDWKFRYGIMKAHTSQHIFSAVIKKKYDIDTERANLSFEDVFIEFSQKVNYKQLNELLTEVNKICTTQNFKMNAKIIPREEAVKNSEKIRSVIPDNSNIRLMEIQDLDLVCCGGTHVKNTTEIGALLIYEFKKGKEIKYVVGNKALEMSTNLNIDLIDLANDINSSIIKLKELLKKRLGLIKKIQNQNNELSFKLLELISKSPLKLINEIPLFLINFEVDIKTINKSLDNFPLNSLLIFKFENNKIRILSLNEIINSNDLLQKLINKFGGKGGGSPKSSQGYLTQMPEDLIAEIELLLLNRYVS